VAAQTKNGSKSRMPGDPAHRKRVLRKMFLSANEDSEFLDSSL
jgi:hypothetical protein